MVYAPSGGSGGVPYGMMAMPYGYMPMRPGQVCVWRVEGGVGGWGGCLFVCFLGGGGALGQVHACWGLDGAEATVRRGSVRGGGAAVQLMACSPAATCMLGAHAPGTSMPRGSRACLIPLQDPAPHASSHLPPLLCALQQEAMMQAYAAGMMAYGPYASPGAGTGGGMPMPMPMSPVGGMQVGRSGVSTRHPS